MLSLHLIPETPPDGPPWACAEIRLLRPYKHRSIANKITVTTGRFVPTGRIDAVVLQRGGPVDFTLEAIVETVAEFKRRSARLIYDYDDDLLAEHPSPPVERGLEGLRPKVRFLLREADIVTVSTPALKQRLEGRLTEVAVWRNALDETLVPPLIFRQGRSGFGYFGTSSHLQDLMAIIGKLAISANRRGQKPSLELGGISDDTRLAKLIPHRLDIVMRQTVEYRRFHAMLARDARCAIGLAPLGAGAFNDAKSDIKALDYAAAAIPVVVSQAPAYSGMSEEIVARASISDFGEVAFALLEDEQRRHRMAIAAYDDLLQNRVLRKRATELFEIVEQVMDQSTIRSSP